MKKNYRYNDGYENRRLDMNNPAHRAKARVGFKIHLFVYLAVISMLWVIAIITGTIWDHPWPIYPMMGWGIGLMGHYFAAYHKYQKWFDREMEKEGVSPPQSRVSRDFSNVQYLDEYDESFELKPLTKEKDKPTAMPRDNDFI